jgi:hypothetical protein
MHPAESRSHFKKNYEPIFFLKISNKFRICLKIKFDIVLEKLNCPRATVPKKPGLKFVTHRGDSRGGLARLDLVPWYYRYPVRNLEKRL